jgi:hypothetical protein
MRIALVVPLWGRLRLAGIVMRYYADLAQTLALEAGIDLVGIAVASEDEAAHEARSAGWHYVGAPNAPLGAKWNTGFRYAREFDVDVFMVCGSDDLISAQYFGLVQKVFADTEGPTSIRQRGVHIYNPAPDDAGTLLYAPGFPTGAGMACNAAALEGASWAPYAPELNRGLDESWRERLIKGPGVRHFEVQDGRALGTPIVDVKTPGGVQLWTADQMAAMTPLEQEMDPAAFWRRFYPGYKTIIDNQTGL